MTLQLETDLISDDHHLVLEGVSWETYESLLRDFETSGQLRFMNVRNDAGWGPRATLRSGRRSID